LFEECEQKSPGDAAGLATAIKKINPAMNVRRPGRLYDTFARIVAPTRPAIHNPAFTI